MSRATAISMEPLEAPRHGDRPERTTTRLLAAPRKAAFSMRWIVTLAAVALITAAVLGVGAVNERTARRALTHEIETRLMLEARNLALSSTEPLLTDFPELALHPLVKAMKSRQPELAMVQVLDHSGTIQGDPDARRLGTPFTAPRALEPIQTVLVMAPGEELLGNREVLVATAPVTHRNGKRIGTTLVGLRRDYLDDALDMARRQQIVALALVLAIGALGAWLLMSLVLRPVGALRDGIERIGHGDLKTPLRLHDKTELGLLADAVNDMAAALSRAQEEMLERERLAHEVELAREIQASLLPSQRTVAGDFVIEGSQRAAAEVGGDYYDFFVLPDGRMGIAVADVSGKGLAGCLVMSMLSALLRAFRHSPLSPSDLLVLLDERLSETLQPGSFVTMFYGVLEPHTGELVYASAGHSPLLVYRAGSGRVEWLKSGGIPLGAVRGGVIRKTLKNASLSIGPGDVIVQFTDGLNEAFDPPRHEQFGFDRMARVVESSAPRGCTAVISALHHALEEWTAGSPPTDDETVLVVSREGVGADRRPRLTLVESKPKAEAALERGREPLPTEPDPVAPVARRLEALVPPPAERPLAPPRLAEARAPIDPLPPRPSDRPVTAPFVESRAPVPNEPPAPSRPLEERHPAPVEPPPTPGPGQIERRRLPETPRPAEIERRAPLRSAATSRPTEPERPAPVVAPATPGRIEVGEAAVALRLLTEARDRGRRLELPASLDTLAPLRSWVASLFPAGVLSDVQFQLLSTALYESAANIAEHGYGQNPRRKIELWWLPAADPRVRGPACRFLIRDHGFPFRADNWRQTDFSDPKVWKRGRGFGLDIIHRVMSRVVYHPGTEEGNLTLMEFDSNDGRERREEQHHVR